MYPKEKRQIQQDWIKRNSDQIVITESNVDWTPMAVLKGEKTNDGKSIRLDPIEEEIRKLSPIEAITEHDTEFLGLVTKYNGGMNATHRTYYVDGDTLHIYYVEGKTKLYHITYDLTHLD